ncbi:Galactose-proton symporter [Mariniblastus fucicola]|uniref:Galactose-proton symporter n=2 Tax=Mariniblastus fucicola TaxID=980251 RepID=A0A5B9PHV8_9BACT|nr:Galactose-proton symporter [Mariniblastus fucicola]
MQNRLFIWSLTAALAGFLFGFDTVVISGAEKTIQSLWQLSPGTHGWAMSMALWGTVLGSMIGGFPTDRLGRKSTLLWIGVLYFVSAIWSAAATDVYSFMIARFIGGVGVGISTVAAPLYISEISPSGQRGWMAGMFQFNIVFGILVALVSNALISGLGENAWRWMLGVEAIPAILYTLFCFGLPKSPRWLIAVKKDRLTAEKILTQINPESDQAKVSSMADEIEQSAPQEDASNGKFWSSQLRKPIALAFLIAFFNQLSGINIILYFAPRLLGLAGFEDPFTAAIGLGLVNLVFTFVGLWLIDKLGRKSLLLIGSIGYILSLGVCGWAFLTNDDFKVVSNAQNVIDAAGVVSMLDSVDYREVSDSEKANARAALGKASVELAKDSDASGARNGVAEIVTVAEEVKAAASKRLGSSSYLVLGCLLAFIASHAVGQGAVIWVFISEIFPNSHRAAGQAFGCFTHWILAALLTLLFPIVIANVDAGWLFVFFCFMMCLQLLWVVTMVPETKGVPLEKIQKMLGLN